MSAAARSGTTVIIVGASTRAAAFSALRAGLAPFCVDLFADADLAARVPCRRVTAADYPQSLPQLLAEMPSASWMYTGALENHPRLIARMARVRPLWGIGPRTLSCVRLPWYLADVLTRAGVPHPETRLTPDQLDPNRQWLQKPVASAGGLGIAFWDGRRPPTMRLWTWQEYIAGEPLSLLFVGRPNAAPLFLGATRMLVGEPTFAAAPFRYCGSIGPLPLDPPRLAQAQHIGQTLAAIPGMLGLFGVDCIDRAGRLHVIEVNPRTTAAAEVLEYAQGIRTLALHAQAFGAELPTTPEPPRVSDSPIAHRPTDTPAHTPTTQESDPVVGKAILYARTRFRFPERGPWTDTLTNPPDPCLPPDFADIPYPGTVIERGWPILTIFATASSISACQAQLQAQALAVERLFLNSGHVCV